MQARSTTLLIGVILALGATTARAHHSWNTVFSEDKPLVLRGTIAKVELVNPHAWIWIDVKAADGMVQKWGIEGGPPNGLIRNGITKDSLKIGTEIVVRGYQSKDGLCRPECRANGRDITFPDGKKLFVGSSGTGAPDERPDK